MPILSSNLPQTDTFFPAYTLKDLVGILPETIPFNDNIWVAGKVVRFGISSDNILFVTDGPVSDKLNDFLLEAVKKLGFYSVVKNEWRNQKFVALRLYQDGELIIDKNTLEFKKLPKAVKEVVLITTDEIRAKLPPTIPWHHEIYLTGGLVKHGWSAKDIDIIVLDPIEPLELIKIKNYFAGIFGWPIDAFSHPEPSREPIYLFKIYRMGRLC